MTYLFIDNNGSSLAPDESSTVHFFTSNSNFNTGISLNDGNIYELQIGILSNWVDGTIMLNESGEAIDETGFANVQMPITAFGLTRRSTNHRWFELMIYQPNCSRGSLRGVTDLNKDEETHGYRFTAVCDGNLHLYVNDSPGFYMNNTGYANIIVSRIN
ncbi:MAG: hypothetical protein OXD01_02210 [Gammaproteobacteria bacterium]|nr:hypothetical protein [Gammaproteobacteria bacterium]